MERNETGMRVLEAARAAWIAGAEFRAKRERYKKFAYGDQWGDLTENRDGKVMTELELARESGKRAMTNNLIRRLIRCVVGRFRLMAESEAEDAGAMGEAKRRNHAAELDSRMLEEFLISGCAVQRVGRGKRLHKEGVWIENVAPWRFFVNRMEDVRGWDAELVGMVHDISIGEVVMRFSGGSVSRGAELRRIYSEAEGIMGAGGGGNTFLHGMRDRCRVIEAWTLEMSERVVCHDPERGVMWHTGAEKEAALERENHRRRREGRREIMSRLEMKTCWHCRWMAPDGSILEEYDSPLDNGEHPFAVMLYPLTDGEVHSLVEDVIGQQIYINRLITLLDHVMGLSAKGALLYPITQRPGNVPFEEIAEQWARPDGVIKYNGAPNMPEPRQIVTEVRDFGAGQLLRLEMKMMEDISGVSTVLMGGDAGNMGKDRYESEIQNSTVMIKDMLMSFNHFRGVRDEKLKRLLR